MSTASTVPHRLVHQLYQFTKTNVSLIFLEITGFIILVLNLVVAELVKAKEWSIDPKIEFCRQKMISLEKLPNRIRGLLKKYYAISLQFFYKIFGTFVAWVWDAKKGANSMLSRFRGLLEKYYSIFILQFFYFFGTFVENVCNIFGKFSTKKMP